MVSDGTRNDGENREVRDDGGNEGRKENARRIEKRVAESLKREGQTIAVAESCTGGLVSSLLTDVPGSSDFFDRAKIVYSYDSPLEELGVNREYLDAYGVVSERVTKEMACRIRDMSGTTWGLSNTGIAGPGGGKEDEGKPVGTAFVAVAYAGEWESGESYSKVRRCEFNGDRKEVKRKIAEASLELVLEEID